MNQTRRDFVRHSSIAASTVLVPTGPWYQTTGWPAPSGQPRMTFRFRPHTLQLRPGFMVAANSRTAPPVALTESSWGISAASGLSSVAVWAARDDALLISKDIFDGTTIVNGTVALPNRPGIAVLASGA